MESLSNVRFAESLKDKQGWLMDGHYHIKVNFPDSEESDRDGNGEGMWVIVDEQTRHDYETDVSGVTRFGILSNDSFYYKGLDAGTPVMFEMRGEYRPVVSYKWLVENYGESVW